MYGLTSSTVASRSIAAGASPLCRARAAATSALRCRSNAFIVEASYERGSAAGTVGWLEGVDLAGDLAHLGLRHLCHSDDGEEEHDVVFQPRDGDPGRECVIERAAQREPWSIREQGGPDTRLDPSEVIVRRRAASPAAGSENRYAREVRRKPWYRVSAVSGSKMAS